MAEALFSEFLKPLVSYLSEDELALRVINELGVVGLVSGFRGFRGVLSFSCRDDICRFEEGYCPYYVLAGAYAMGVFRDLLMISARASSRRVVSSEAFGVILDDLPYLVPYGLYDNVVYVPSADTPENRLLKFILESARRCIKSSKCGSLTTGWLGSELDFVLSNTWISTVSLDRYDEFDLSELRFRYPYLHSPYDVLLNLVGYGALGEYGIDYLYRLFEVYVLSLIVNGIKHRLGDNAMIDHNDASLLTIRLGNVDVHYQMDVDKKCAGSGFRCRVADIVVEVNGEVRCIVEVKLSGYPEYIRDGARQVMDYVRSCGGKPRPVLVYYGSQLYREYGECYGDVELVQLSMNKGRDLELLGELCFLRP